LETLPETPERIGLELGLQTPLAVALMNLRGYAYPRVGEAFTRAHELCKKIGETPQIAMVLYGLWAFYFTKAEFGSAIELAEQILRLAPKAEDPTMWLLIGHNAQAANWSMLGELDRAREHAEKVIVSYNPQKHHALAFLIGQDLMPTSTSWIFLDLWFLGYPDQGKQRLQDAVKFCREWPHPYTLSFLLTYAIIFYQLHRDVNAVRKTVDELRRLSTEYGFQIWFGITDVFEGWALAEQHHVVSGIAQIREGLSANQAAGTIVFRAYHLSILAEAHMKANQIPEGLEVLNEGLTLTEKTRDSFYEAELHRLQGELMLMQNANEEEVERSYHKAIDVARKQGAKSLELRATTSLARLWQKHGMKKEARQRLSEIYDWFTEGFDTHDLIEAKALLEELSTK
jgi:adenylate cyclase